ncbi:MAG: leucyl aminopeptidase [Alphaproteobacteria bacterium]|nr:leucyl aminopeptidase [Alphaproteobacteria bacterium]
MKITFEAKSGHKQDAFVVFVAEDGKLDFFDKKMKVAVKRSMQAAAFSGKKGAILAIPGLAETNTSYIIVVGLGKLQDLKLNDFEKIGSALVKELNARKAVSAQVIFCDKLKNIAEDEAVSRMATGMLLNSYRFDKYMTKKLKEKKSTLKSVRFIVKSAPAARKKFDTSRKVTDAVFLTRDLVSEAPNILYPKSFADIIRRELSPLGIEVKILNRKDLKKLGMGALLSVGQGSVREEKLVTMQYRGGKKNQKNIAFVGKGVTFDTGGISLKPGAGMEKMKYDMAGAAVVTGLMKVLAARRAKANVIGIVALAENMPSGSAARPGDIVKTMSGQTVEIHNTDAEGRMVLCDALWYVQEKFKPSHIVDLATLTGSIVIALGSEYAGMFSNDEQLPLHLISAGKEVGEELWQMPLNEVWDKAIDSTVADMKNIGGGREAGSSTAAHFLKRFIQKGVTWAHLDIAGMAWVNKERTSVPKGASGFGVRLLDRYVAEYCEK